MNISVIIPLYNEAQTIEKCIRSIQAQTLKPFEVIVVDNNSTDDGDQIAVESGAKVIRENRQGPAWARLAGFKESRGEIIAYTDGDCVADKNWLSVIAESFQNPRVIGLSGRVYFIDKNKRELLYNDNFYWNFWHKFLFFIGIPNIWGANFAARRSVIKESYFATHLNSYEDLILARKIKHHRKKGEQLIYNPKAKVYTYDYLLK